MVRVLLTVALFSLSIQAQTSHAKEKLIATPMNSPVKETYLKVKLEGFNSVAEVLFKPKNGGNEVSGEVVKEGNLFIGKFKGSSLKPGIYEYRVKIRTSSGSSNQDESASVAFVKFVIDASLEVPIPDPKIDEATLLGVDSDNNGVPDRVQRWINENYTSRKNVKNALKQFARRSQESIVTGDSRTVAREAIKKSLAASDCLDFILNNDLSASNQTRKLLEVEFYNTKERLLAEANVNRHWRGADVTTYDPLAVEDKLKCEFIIE